MIGYFCDVCGYLIRGSVCFLYEKHFCSSECVQNFEKGPNHDTSEPMQQKLDHSLSKSEPREGAENHLAPQST